MTKYVLAIEIEAATPTQAETMANKLKEHLPAGARLQAIGLRTAWYDETRGWMRDA